MKITAREIGHKFKTLVFRLSSYGSRQRLRAFDTVNSLSAPCMYFRRLGDVSLLNDVRLVKWCRRCNSTFVGYFMRTIYCGIFKKTGIFSFRFQLPHYSHGLFPFTNKNRAAFCRTATITVMVPYAESLCKCQL